MPDKRRKRGTGGMKQAIRIAILGAFLLFASGCAAPKEDGIVLRVANWEEYIDEGDWDKEDEIVLGDGTSVMGVNPMVEDFTRWYQETYGEKVTVEYSTFGTNEDLYNQLAIGDRFDVVCPSEYMIMKLMAEGKVQPFSEEFFDMGTEENYYAKGVSPYIYQRLKQQKIQGCALAEYAACYMWGTLGFVYNPDRITKEEASDWNLLRSRKFYKQITVKDSVRDCYFAAAGMLHQKEVSSEKFRNAADYPERLSEKLNDASPETISRIEQLLTEVKENSYSFETDSGKSDLVTQKVSANLQWSGDAVYSMEQAAEDGVTLKYAVPDSCTNLWFDGWCLLREGIEGDREKQHAAEAFVNFLSRPDNVIRNMNYIGYTSAVAGGEDDLVYQYAEWCYGADEEQKDTVEYPLGYFFSGNPQDKRYIMTAEKEQSDGELFSQYPPEDVLKRSVVMAYFDAVTNKRINRMWTNVRCFDIKNLIPW